MPLFYYSVQRDIVDKLGIFVLRQVRSILLSPAGGLITGSGLLAAIPTLTHSRFL